MVFQENGEVISRHQQGTKEVVKEIDARLCDPTQASHAFQCGPTQPPALFRCDPTQASHAFSLRYHDLHSRRWLFHSDLPTGRLEQGKK